MYDRKIIWMRLNDYLNLSIIRFNRQIILFVGEYRLYSLDFDELSGRYHIRWSYSTLWDRPDI